LNKSNAYPWNFERRFNAYSNYIRSVFGERVQKLSIDAGFSCPNRDGTLGKGGCSFCNNNAFNPSYCRESGSIEEQISRGIRFHSGRYRKATRYLVYFQAYSNTYASLDELKKKYSVALDSELIAGIVIGTRPDCVDDSVLDYLAELKEKTYLTLELGIESCYDKTLQRINRGHNFATTRDAFERAGRRGIRTGGHVIIGLPGENRQEILNQAGILSELPVGQLKFHQLQIVKGTEMGKDYRLNPEEYHEFELDEYLELMMEFLEKLSPSIVVERIAGETVPEYNLRSSWGLRYDMVLRKFENLLEKNDSWQGKRFKNQI